MAIFIKMRKNAHMKAFFPFISKIVVETKINIGQLVTEKSIDYKIRNGH